MAWEQYLKFKHIGDDAAAAANYQVWTKLTPLWQRLAQRVESYFLAYVRRARQLGLLGTLSRIRAKLSSRNTVTAKSG
jgi:hypothetical protein